MGIVAVTGVIVTFVARIGKLMRLSLRRVHIIHREGTENILLTALGAR